MIKMDVSFAAGAFLFAAFVVFYVALMWCEHYQGVDNFDVNADLTDHVRQCPYCGHVCVDYLHRKILRCSICSSYTEEDDA